jgi:hypothetical protein
VNTSSRENRAAVRENHQQENKIHLRNGVQKTLRGRHAATQRTIWRKRKSMSLVTTKECGKSRRKAAEERLWGAKLRVSPSQDFFHFQWLILHQVSGSLRATSRNRRSAKPKNFARKEFQYNEKATVLFSGGMSILLAY